MLSDMDSSSIQMNEQTIGASIPANKIDGWMTDRELAWLAEKASESEIIIEIGSYKGRSSKALADNCIGRIYCIDPWNGPYYNDDNSLNKETITNVYDQFHSNLKNHIDSGKLIPLKGFSKDFSFWKCADLIFIDGDHREAAVRDDIKRALDWIRPGGIVSGHDYGVAWWPAVKRVVDELFPNRIIEDTIWYTQIQK